MKILLLLITLTTMTACAVQKSENAEVADFLPAIVSATVNLALECKAIPHSAEQICVAATPAEFNAVDDVVFYRRSADHYLSLLSVEFGDVAVIWLHSFSAGGKYTVVGHAEEGHPSFVIYTTADFLSPNKELKPVAVISDYFIASLDSLDDSGMADVTYLNNIGCEEPDTSDCSGQINIFAQR